MSACTNNLSLRSLLQQEADDQQLSASYLQPKDVEIPPPEKNAWCVVATDGSTSIIGCRSPRKMVALKHTRQNLVRPHVSPIEQICSESRDTAQHEDGLDLSYLEVEKDTTSKLIAGLHAMAEHEPPVVVKSEIAMPSTMTDLQQIFKSDKICVINAPQHAPPKPVQTENPESAKKPMVHKTADRNKPNENIKIDVVGK